MPKTPEPAAAEMLTSLLRDVSRSFYLTLRVLPGAIRKQIGVAYLLARATDTIADTEIAPLTGRMGTLATLRARILGETKTPLDLGTLANQQGTLGEQTLIRRIDEAIQILESFSETDRTLVREALKTITSGQELDLKRFALAKAGMVVALREGAELDDYTYRVAGCVGEFWTKMCLAHLGKPRGVAAETLIADGIRFGKGLQLVNILRDLSADLLKGRCYLPADELKKIGLRPGDLLNPGKFEQFRPLYMEFLARAETRLEAGWRYTNSLPFSWPRVRLACAWPILIGFRTIAHLREANVLDGSRRVKASRGEVKRLMAASAAAYPLPFLWRRLVKIARRTG